MRKAEEIIFRARLELLNECLDALRDLYDRQNGPPLLAKRHKEAWESAMKKAEEVLKKHGK
jgi:hypothetical protein